MDRLISTIQAPHVSLMFFKSLNPEKLNEEGSKIVKSWEEQKGSVEETFALLEHEFRSILLSDDAEES